MEDSMPSLPIVRFLIAVLITSASLLSQVRQQGGVFEVASVKRNLSTQAGGGGGPRGDRFVMTNVPLTSLVSFAFRAPNGRLFNQQIIGGPDWIRSDRFDINAKMNAAIPTITYQEVQLMVRSLLEDRFQLKWHQEMRELPVYNLVVAKGGLKMRPSGDQTPPDPNHADLFFDSIEARSASLPRGAVRLATGPDSSALIGNSARIASLVTLLQGQADRIVFDRTDLKELFDFDLLFSNEVKVPRAANDGALDSGGQTAPSLFTAIQELGLRLEPSKAPLEVVVIDSVQRPSEN